MPRSRITLARDLEKQVMKAARSGVEQVAGEYERMFDSVYRRYHGQPVEQIKPVIRREWSRVGGSITDPELTRYAQAISDGSRVKMRLDM